MRICTFLMIFSLIFSCTSKKETTIKALLLTGGCCHNYEYQKKKIQEFTSKKLNIKWDVLHEGGVLKDHKLSIYNSENWSDKYDVVVHNECFGKMIDDNFINNAVNDHLKSDIGIVMLHCAMHTYRKADEGKDAWTKMIGLESKKHDHQDNYIVNNVLHFGYHISFKLIDRGILELFGPLGITRSLALITKKVSRFQSGLIYHYVFLMILGLTFIILLFFVSLHLKASLLIIFFYFFVYLNSLT